MELPDLWQMQTSSCFCCMGFTTYVRITSGTKIGVIFCMTGSLASWLMVVLKLKHDLHVHTWALYCLQQDALPPPWANERGKKKRKEKRKKRKY